MSHTIEDHMDMINFLSKRFMNLLYLDDNQLVIMCLKHDISHEFPLQYHRLTVVVVGFVLNNVYYHSCSVS